MADIIERLCNGSGVDFPCPMTPEDASELISTELLSGLGGEQRDLAKRAIREWGSAWGHLTASTAAEASRDY